MQEFARQFYKSLAWQRCRKAYIISMYGLCERCGRPGKIVHHRVLLSPANIDDPTVTLNPDNLELLCQDCHTKHHMGSEVLGDGLRFTADGDLIASGRTTDG